MGIEWNSLLAYSTVKIVKVRDWRLGVLHFSFVIAIFLYVVIFSLIVQKKYVLTVTPTGSIRTSLLAPKIGDKNDFTPPDNLPFCLTVNNTKYRGFENLQCYYLDENFVLFPIVEDHAMFITTRLTLTTQTVNNCSLDDYTCNYIDLNSTDYFIPDVERFTILIDHTCYADAMLQRNSGQLKGYMVDVNGKIMTNLTKLPNQIGVSGKPDIIQLGSLLRAGGVWDLDTPSQANKSRSIRNDGVVIIVTITYTNLADYNLSNVIYTYKVNYLSDTKFKALEPIFTKNIDTRTIWNRHGVRIVFIQTGSIGQFDFLTMILTFVTGMGLLAAATIVVDTIATKIMPKSDLIASYKYEEKELKRLRKESINNAV
jgi:hypothetical protein